MKSKRKSGLDAQQPESDAWTARHFLKNLMKVLDPIRDRYESLAKKKQMVRDRLDANAERCRGVATKTILEAKEKMGIAPVWKI